MMSALNAGAAHGMIGFTGVRELQNKDWLMQVPFVMLNAGEQRGASGVGVGRRVGSRFGSGGAQAAVAHRCRPLTPAPRPPCAAAVAGLWGAAFNSGRMTLWRVRASKTRHVLRIAEVIGLAIVVQVTGSAGAAGGPQAAGRPPAG
jgi:chloride channel 7